jgi:hypothetical protein
VIKYNSIHPKTYILIRYKKDIFLNVIIYYIMTSQARIFSANDGFVLGSNTINANAALEINSTTKGILLPRMTTIQRNTLPNLEGMMVYDIDLNQLFVNDGVVWAEASGEGGGGAINDLTDGNTTAATSISLGNSTPNAVGSVIISRSTGAITGTSNTIIGGTAGATLTTGQNNCIIGNNCDVKTSTDQRVICIGASNAARNGCIGIGFQQGTESLGEDTIAIGFRAEPGAQYSIAIGYNSVGAAFVSGGLNIGIGRNSCRINNILSTQNTCIGDQAGANMQGGSDNTFIGFEAGRLNNSRQRNTMYGSLSGSGNNHGNDNTMIGYNTSLSAAINNCIVIGSGAIGSVASALHLPTTLANVVPVAGAKAVQYNPITGQLGAASDALMLPRNANDPATLITGSLAYNNTSNTVKFYNGTAWTGLGGANAINDLSDAATGGTRTLFIATGIAAVPAGINDTVAIGDGAGESSVTGLQNVFIGSDAGRQVTGNNGVMVGFRAGNGITTGVNNVCIGSETGVTTNNGVAVGYSALSGASGVAIGSFARGFGDNNVSVGTEAGNGAGANNTCVGQSAGNTLLTAGIDNTFLGFSAGGAVTSGVGNVCIGRSANVDAAARSNCIVIGSNITSTALDNSLTLPTSLVSVAPVINAKAVQFDPATGQMGPAGDALVIPVNFSTPATAIEGGIAYNNTDNTVIFCNNFQYEELSDRYSLLTTSAAVTQIIQQISLFPGNAVGIEAMISCTRTDATPGSKAAFFILRGGFRNGGSIVVIGTETKEVRSDDPGLDVSFTISGTNININVTGVAAETYNWKSKVRRVWVF